MMVEGKSHAESHLCIDYMTADAGLACSCYCSCHDDSKCGSLSLRQAFGVYLACRGDRLSQSSVYITQPAKRKQSSINQILAASSACTTHIQTNHVRYVQHAIFVGHPSHLCGRHLSHPPMHSHRFTLFLFVLCCSSVSMCVMAALIPWQNNVTNHQNDT